MKISRLIKGLDVILKEMGDIEVEIYLPARELPITAPIEDIITGKIEGEQIVILMG